MNVRGDLPGLRTKEYYFHLVLGGLQFLYLEKLRGDGYCSRLAPILGDQLRPFLTGRPLN